MKYLLFLLILNFVRSPFVVLDLEARCIVNEILEYFFLKGCEIIWMLVFRLHDLGRTRALKVYLGEKSVYKRKFTYKTLLPVKVNFDLFFHFKIN